jgi:hypothetical protein
MIVSKSTPSVLLALSTDLTKTFTPALLQPHMHKVGELLVSPASSAQCQRPGFYAPDGTLLVPPDPF